MSGATITGGLHRAQILASPTQKRRSVLRRQGRVTPSLVDGELLVQGEVLESELAVAGEEEGQESKHAEQERDHRAGILSGSAPTDQPLGCRPEFWRGTGQSGRRPLAARCLRRTHRKGHSEGSRSRNAGAGGAASIR